MGWYSSLWAPGARSATITSCSEESSGSNFSPECGLSNADCGSWLAGTENAAT